MNITCGSESEKALRKSYFVQSIQLNDWQHSTMQKATAIYAFILPAASVFILIKTYVIIVAE